MSDRVEEARTESAYAALPAGAGFASPDPAAWARAAPDLHLAVTRGGAALARASLWWTAAPPLAGRRPGAIGHFGAADAASARLLLDAAAARLGREGRDLALGPLDGNTWRAHRFVTGGDPAEPPFPLEPVNPPEWPAWWAAAGFAPFARYASALVPDLSRPDPRLARAQARLEAAGVRLRPLDPARFGEELDAIHGVALESFADNLLYTPLSRAEFRAIYEPLRARLDPALVWVAEQDGRAAGFVLALPDLARAARGAPLDTVVVKTLAVRPGRARAGLGALLLEQVRREAAARGFTRAIHALMHEHNRSRNMDGPAGRDIRAYTLFARGTA